MGCWEHVPPHLSKTWTKCPLSSNLVALLENFEDVKINRKIHASSNFRRSKVQNGNAPRSPLVDLHLGAGTILTLLHHAHSFVISLSALPPRQSAQPYHSAHQSTCPHFYNASYFLASTPEKFRKFRVSCSFL